MRNKRKAVSAVKLENKLEKIAEDVCYLRQTGTDTNKVWIPASKSVTSVRISDFILQQVQPNVPVARLAVPVGE